MAKRKGDRWGEESAGRQKDKTETPLEKQTEMLDKGTDGQKIKTVTAMDQQTKEMNMEEKEQR